jgi:hypothetical protein
VDLNDEAAIGERSVVGAAAGYIPVSTAGEAAARGAVITGV